MTKKLLFSLFILSSIIFPANHNIYSVAEFIDYLSIEHTKPAILKSQRTISQLNYRSAISISDWAVGTSLFSSHVEPFQTSSFVSSGIDTFGSSFDIHRPFLSTGGSISFGIHSQKINQAAVSFNGLTLNEPIYFENKISVTYNQPLLFGFLGESLNYPILVASKNIEQTYYSTEEAFETHILNELTDYIDWVLSHEVTELSFARLQLARESLKQTQERVRVNLSEKIDLLRAEFSVQKAHQLWLSQKANLKSVQYKFSSKLDNQSLLSKVPKFDLYEIVYVKKPSYIITEKLRFVRQFDLNLSPLKTQLELSKSQRNGSLNLSTTYDFLGGNSTFIDSQNFLNNNLTVALNYSRPLSDTQTIAQMRSNEEKLLQHNYERDQLIIDLESEILSLYTLTEEYKKILTTTLNQILIAQQKADAEQGLYNQGRSSLDMVIQAQDNVLDSKLNYANLSANYQKLIITYQALIDELLSSYDIKLTNVDIIIDKQLIKL